MTLTLSMNPPTKVRVDNAIKTEYLNTESRLKCGFFCYRNGGRIAKDTKLLFSIPSHQNISPTAFIDTLQLEESEYGLIKYPERGTFLYRCGNERYLLQVIAPVYKAALFGSAGGR